MTAAAWCQRTSSNPSGSVARTSAQHLVQERRRIEHRQRPQRHLGFCRCQASNGSDADDGSVSSGLSKLRYNKDFPTTHHNPESPEHLGVTELPEHLRDLRLGDDGLLIDGKTGRVVNGLGATRFDVAVRALRGELDPKPWEENSERAPGVLLQSLVTFPSNYTFQVVGASEGGCPAGVHAEFVDDMVATVARITEMSLPLGDGAVTQRQRLGGKYVSLSITVNVRAPEIVTRVYDELAKDPRVKMRF